MKAEDILEKYGLTKETTTRYIDAITRMNQTEAAEELEVSRDTVNRYKKAFDKMTDLERGQLIASLTTDKLLRQAYKQSER
ncbi:hypothetical protein [Halopiger aswanensis]|uniref:Uncharacterized protein n=1 Tax=Halopiger aswanensis TaxID=148449 RepID=A0A3R7DAL5_9EURY|nr:hypothetical protein [Halopiger aswanensis]RKD95653.1 hypothetical protein ATJ93_2514 [Halopiger aswanensis]